MTQKELLYIEDAIGHEKNIISILNESISVLEDTNLINFLKKELRKHQGLEEKLMDKMEELANE